MRIPLRIQVAIRALRGQAVSYRMRYQVPEGRYAVGKDGFIPDQEAWIVECRFDGVETVWIGDRETGYPEPRMEERQ